jgi:RNA polymerase sigma factor (TIGR02999 family)
MSDLSQILSAIAQGDSHAASKLLPLVYDELRRLAAQRLSREAAGQTLQATALVHEAYMRLIGNEDQTATDKEQKKWDGRGHFFAAAAEAMRRILVENARRKHRHKRGGSLIRQELNEAVLVAAEPNEDLLALDEALDRLAEKEPAKAELVKLRYFAGLTGAQAAEALHISTATGERWWAFARAWLLKEMTRCSPTDA